jgi:hypothetical protein
MFSGRVKYALMGAAVAAALAAGSIAVWGGSPHAAAPRTMPAPHAAAPRTMPATPASSPVARSSRPDAADWHAIQAAVSLRQNALQPHHTAFHRAFAAYMGLSQLMQLHPILPGRCAIAVSYLYDNLLDLREAYTGEDWTPLRRAVATEPSLSVCAPRPSSPRAHVRYES